MGVREVAVGLRGVGVRRREAKGRPFLLSLAHRISGQDLTFTGSSSICSSEISFLAEPRHTNNQLAYDSIANLLPVSDRLAACRPHAFLATTVNQVVWGT